jgi:hypothetical protein
MARKSAIKRAPHTLFNLWSLGSFTPRRYQGPIKEAPPTLFNLWSRGSFKPRRYQGPTKEGPTYTVQSNLMAVSHLVGTKGRPKRAPHTLFNLISWQFHTSSVPRADQNVPTYTVQSLISWQFHTSSVPRADQRGPTYTVQSLMSWQFHTSSVPRADQRRPHIHCSM